MITVGSKLLIGGAVAAVVYAVAFGLAGRGTLGVIGIVASALALALLAGIAVFTRDATVHATAVAEQSPAARRAAGSSPWPLMTVAGLVAVAVGLVTYPVVVILGLVVLVGGIAEWMVQAWAESGSADPDFNADVRARIAQPIETAIMAAVLGVVVIYFFSRVMLTLTKSGSTIILVVAAGLILLVAALLSRRPGVSRPTIAGVIALAAVALVAGGVAGAINGEREMHVIETTADLADRGRCGTEASEADEKSSQTVGAKSNPAATLTLADDGTLSASLPGFTESSSRVTLPRSNNNNILFRNESSEERRLVVDLGPAADETGSARVMCTALVEPGGVQFMTVQLTTPSFALEEDLRFTVPGVDTAVVDIIVP